MTDTAERLKEQLASLSAADRAALAHFLIASLDQETDADAEAAWDAELARRAEEIRNGTARGKPAPTAPNQRVPGLHAGSTWTSDDFDAPLADDFWNGTP